MLYSIYRFCGWWGTGWQATPGCEVHRNRSYQRVSQKVCKHHHPAKWQTARQAFHLISAAITKAKTQDQVYRVFRCLCGDLKFVMYIGLWSQVWNLTMLMLWIHSGPNDWKSANHWVSLWTHQNYLRMLSVQAFHKYGSGAFWRVSSNN